MGTPTFFDFCQTRLAAARFADCLREALAGVESEPLFESVGEETQTFTHRATRQFLSMWNDLPAEVAEQAQEKFKMLQANPREPSLFFGPWAGGRGVWQVYVNYRYRALATRTKNTRGDVFVWFWIGPREVLNHYERFQGHQASVPDINKRMGSPQRPAEIR